jgi:hypothetical protein
VILVKKNICEELKLKLDKYKVKELTDSQEHLDVIKTHWEEYP